MMNNIIHQYLRGYDMAKSKRGLFHGKTKLHGHRISFSHRVTKRTWSPNIQTKTLRSDLLNTNFKIKLTTKALRCIEKMGGLDNYILLTKKSKLKSETGERLREYLIPIWEEKNGRPFRRNLIIFERNLQKLVERGKIDSETANALIEKERGKLALKRLKREAMNVTKEDVEKILLDELEKGIKFLH